MVALILISSYTSDFVEYFGGGQQGWRMVALIYSIICFIGLMIPVIAVRELPPDESEEKNVDQDQAEEEKMGFFQGFLFVLKNKYFIMILLYYLFFYLFNGIFSGLGIYFTTYSLKNAGLLGAITMAVRFPTIIMLLFVPKLADRFGLRKTALVGSCIGFVGAMISYLGGNLGIFNLLLVGMAIKAIGVAPMTGSLNALIAATDDYSYLKFGKRMTGTIYSCSSIGIKVGTGLGTAVCGYLLDWSGYDGMAETQTDAAIAAIHHGYFLSLVLLTVTAARRIAGN